MAGQRQPLDLILVFGTVQRVMRAEREARERGIEVDAVPAPRTVSSECGVVLSAHAADAEALASVCSGLGIQPAAVYWLRSGTWLPTTLDACADQAGDTGGDGPVVALTRGTAYGGCGAKLSKGLLSTILCGLPRLESEDLLVGIERADDAGVIRITGDLAVIHTTDFFPPMVDDPFSFGRIAATNALSDVYAMGGRPLGGMNLVSFPLAEHPREVLRDILRGGLSALEEAGAVLAGGHTVEGQELLYGMAVTGTVHPDRIWRNGGARPGDVLVLTKPLGTGLITTAAKAELVAPEHLAAAVRWMSTLNRDAAEAVHGVAAHAVTDVTGFGLAGHGAEMAEASGLELVLDLDALPRLPGALQAAAQGLVPAGTAKNHESLARQLHPDPEADPLLIDLALDPQTSGGLLVACEPDQAETLARRLPGAAVIGHARNGEPGAIHLVTGSHPVTGSRIR
jgi:selenide,water dikinase